MSFLDIATPLIAMGIPITPVMPGTKRAFLPDFPTTATTDPNKIQEWSQLYPEHNAAAVARAEDGGVWFFETDSADVAARVSKDTGHDLSEIVTFKVRSRPGRGHFYFRHNDRSRALGNISQGYVIGGDWSVRTNREYVVAAGSRHPDTGLPYTALNPGTPLSVAPDWLIDWLISQKVGKTGNAKTDAPRDAQGMVPKGSVHSYMLTQAGRLRAMGLEADAIEVALLQLVHANCEPPIDEERVVTMSKSICNFPAGEASGVKIPLGTGADDDTDGILVENGITYALLPNNVRVPLDTRETAARPRFPNWIMVGTSLYEHLVKPAVETSSKYSELIFVPAMQLMMNYLSRQVRIGLHATDMNLFVGLVTPFGEYFKSSSCKLGQDYLHAAGISKKHGKDVKMAEGLVLIGQAGSPEGFGIQMQKVNGNHAILFFDELGKLVSKAGIEGSGFSSDLLTWYGGEDFGNAITNSKHNFNFPAGTYTFGWLWCTTDRNFNHFWPKLAGIASGIEDRMFFVVAPEKPRPAGLYSDPSFGEGPKITRALIERAVTQENYQLEDAKYFQAKAQGLDPRSLNMMVKFSLYFAIDLGLDFVDNDCVDRALALVRYRNQASAYLEPIEAENSEGRLQKEIIREIRQHGGRIPYRDLCLNLDYGRFGTRNWDGAVRGLLSQKELVDFQERRTKGKRKTRMIGIVRHPDDWDDDTGQPRE